MSPTYVKSRDICPWLNTRIGSRARMARANSIGAIVIPGNSAAINTNIAQASSLGTADPWANLSE